MAQYDELFDIVNEAKNIGRYDISNVAFATLYRLSLYNQVNHEYHVILETENGMDEYYDVLYYDVVNITRGDGVHVCIPLPLLTFEAALILVKNAYTVDRHVHDRNVGDPDPYEAENLIVCLRTYTDKLLRGRVEIERTLDVSAMYEDEQERLCALLDELFKEKEEC